MAHNLMQNADGSYAFFSANGKHGLPWHKLGQKVNDAQNWQSAMKLAGLDWTVEKQNLFDINGNPLQAWGTFRDGNIFLGVVGAGYEPIQNQYAFDFIDTLLEAEDGSHYESAGALGNGERIWALARIPYDITIKGTDDKSESYLLFTTAHDGSMSAISKITSVRVVCNNTLSQAMGKDSNAIIKVKHTKNAEVRLNEAKKLMSNVRQDIDTLSDKLNELALRKVNADSFTTVMSRLFPDFQDSTQKKKQIAEIAMLFESNDNNAIPEIRGTAYNLLNSFTEYTDHNRSMRQTSSKQGMTEVEIRSESALFGTGEAFKQKAIDAIMDATVYSQRRSPTVSVIGSYDPIDSILSSVNPLN
jgi:phage/plasmid-like protein (TIGR03299 family)